MQQGKVGDSWRQKGHREAKNDKKLMFKNVARKKMRSVCITDTMIK